MAKKQKSFADKVKGTSTSRKLAKLVISERKENGHFRYRTKMVPAEDVSAELKALK